MKLQVKLNGQNQALDASPDASLAEVLRSLHLFSIKKSGQNGSGSSCTILLNGKPVPGDIIPIAVLKNANIVTLEHFMQTEDYKDIKEGFEQEGINLCGYCNAGKIFTAWDIIQTYKRPTAEEIEAAVSGMSFCCTNKKAYITGIRRAILLRTKRIGNMRNGRR
ncbi:ferredoxin [Treponema parvum]|uniref:Ferredoxin n=1 Tax=Treponema parvum TaxID=138851 RepID=A0A975F0F5_9SPIR|nr:2Fe-2S iron-sulfur cluster-binding protein [Treponema parvum]QTQ11980.1 ferredoxin [Treponema parvum]QTQ16042.1 ferredoxin [Treponema parvum]